MTSIKGCVPEGAIMLKNLAASKCVAAATMYRILKIRIVYNDLLIYYFKEH